MCFSRVQDSDDSEDEDYNEDDALVAAANAFAERQALEECAHPPALFPHTTRTICNRAHNIRRTCEGLGEGLGSQPGRACTGDGGWAVLTVL